MVQCGSLNGVPESNVLTQTCHSCGSGTSMTFLAATGTRPGTTVAWSHGHLKLRLNTVPVGLGMLGLQNVDFDSQLCGVLQLVGVGHSSPFITGNNCPTANMLLCYRQ